MAKMGLQFGLEGNGKFCKRNFRWLFEIPEVCADESSSGVDSLPPEKSARPTLSFKEMMVNHISEDVYFPAKPDWKPINVTLYDLKQGGEHPVFKWIKEIYDPQAGKFYAPKEKKFIKECRLKMLDATGETIETWIYEDAWPNNINFQTLDMQNNGIAMCEFTLRYSRAYIED